jgi:hypothetical protein
MAKVYVELTDTFDSWRQKTNAMMDVVYSLAGNGAVSVTSPADGQILVCHNNVFSNVTPYGDVTIDYTGHTTVVGGTGTNVTKGRMRFAGSIRGLY